MSPDDPVASSQSATSRPFESLLREFRRRWEEGERPQAESYLPLVDPSRPYEASELIYQEFCLARKAGVPVDSSEFLRRFPQHERSLSRLFALHETLATSELGAWGEACPLPEAGDEIGPYRLIRLLGQGGFARVFLAQQVDLDDRLLVVKVSTRITSEPRLLARLRHSHVVEVIRQATTADGELQLICMPFLGGATLADVLKAIKDQKKRPKTGADFLACLDRVSAREYPETEVHSPARKVIASLSYPKAIAWIVARLAEALDHSERRAVLHGDVKPSNILIPASGMPMLFDFNLSVDWHAQDALEGPPAQVGGTLAYLAPERLNSLLASTSGTQKSDRKPHRADLYSLGLVLLEAVSGGSVLKATDHTFGPRALIADLAGERRRGAAAFSSLMRKVPASLRPILNHLLTADPADRFARGEELATDLECWIADRPTVYTDAPPWHVRAKRLVRRRRGQISVAAVVIASICVTLHVSSTRFHARSARLANEKLDKFLDNRTSGPFRLQKYGDWSAKQGDPAAMLAEYDVINADNWQEHESYVFLEEAEREDLEAFMLDQSYRMAKSLIERPDSPGDWKEAIRLVDKTLARADFKTFRRLRERLEERLGRETPTPARRASTVPPPHYLQDFLEGVEASDLHARYALECFTRCLEAKSDFFWARYRSANVACRLDFYTFAEYHLQKCLERRPRNAALHTQFAALLFKNQKLTEAISECEAALKLDPEFQEACYTLAMLKRVGAQDKGSSDAIGRVVILSRGKSDPSVRRFLDLTTALQYGEVFDFIPKLNEKDLRELLADRPDNQVARVILATYLGRSGQPEESIAEYDRVLGLNPDHLWARYSRALVLKDTEAETYLCRSRRPGESIEEYARFIILNPDHLLARCSRTLVLKDTQRKEARRELGLIIAHPRFEELYREDPNANRIHRFIVDDRIDNGDYLGALHAAAKGLIHAQRRSNGLLEANYAMARALVPFAQDELYYLTECANLLREAEKHHPDFPRLWYRDDPIFDELRPKLSPLLGETWVGLSTLIQLPLRNRTASGIRLATP